MKIGQRVKTENGQIGRIIEIKENRVSKIVLDTGKIIDVVDKGVQLWPLIKQLFQTVMGWFRN